MPGKVLLEGTWKTTTTRECRTETRRLQQRECRTEILPQSATNRGGRRTKYMEIVKSGQKLSWEQNVTFSLDDYRVALQMCSKDRSYCAGDDMKRRWCCFVIVLGEIRTRRGGRRGNKQEWQKCVKVTICPMSRNNFVLHKKWHQQQGVWRSHDKLWLLLCAPKS